LSSSVRPRKTGLIVFASRIVSVFTGLLFLVMMTRSLALSQFGLWEFIIDVVAFAAYPTGIITYWATREVARGKPVARTALLTSQLTSVIGVGIYLVLAFLSYRVVGSAIGPFLLAIALVPLAYWTQSSASLVSGYDPAINGYSLFLSEPAKLIFAYPLLFVFKTGIYGVIISIAVSYFVQGLYATYRLRPASTDKFDFSLGLRWLSEWQVPTLVTVSYILGIADTFVASLGQGGTSLAGYYQAAFQIATIVSYATYLSAALYPMMLRNASDRLPGEVLEFALLFAIPMTSGAIALAPKILYLLKPDYVASSPALVVLSFAALAVLVSVIMDQSLMGREKADLAVENRTRRILGSDLFFVSAANVSFSSAYVIAVFVIGYAGTRSGVSDAQLAVYWATAQLVTWSALAALKVMRLRSRIRFTVSPWVVGYAACGVLMGVVVYFLGGAVLATGLRGLDYGLRLGLLILVGSAIYFGLVVALDKKVRGYAMAVLASVR
jgi:O-antigen/teichoic acid export membrane protein